MHRAAPVCLLAAAVLAFALPADAQSKKLLRKNHACCAQGTPTDWPLYNKGVHWEESLEAAQAAARETRRPILLHVLVGDMSKEGT